MNADALFVVRYAGPFGFIKPWTAVRDGETFSQQFLTPSIVEGMRQKLDVSAILRHRLSYLAISRQTEQTQPRAWDVTGPAKRRTYTRARAILTRGVMIEPILTLAFPTEADAERAATQHLCLCRNEDVLLPDGEPVAMSAAEFDGIAGFELRFGEGPGAFLVGYNRFDNGRPMHGALEIVGNPTASRLER